MENIKMDVKGNKLIVEIDLKHEGGFSKSGKSKVIASTKGNVTVPGANENIKIGINCYKPVS